jgi:Tetratricopeptide repeat
MAEKFALAYQENGRRQEVLQLTETAVAARKRTLGKEHPDILDSMDNLAIRHGEVGRREKALQLTETIVTARKRRLGEEHSHTLGSMHNLSVDSSLAFSILFLISSLAADGARWDTLDPNATALAGCLDGLPLAPATAGTYLRQNADDFSDYPKRYIDKWDDLDQYVLLGVLYSPYHRCNVCDAFA